MLTVLLVNQELTVWSDLNGPALLFTVLEAVLNLNVELLIAEQDISASKVTFYAAVEHDASVATLTRFFPFHLNSQLLAIRVYIQFSFIDIASVTIITVSRHFTEIQILSPNMPP